MWLSGCIPFFVNLGGKMKLSEMNTKQLAGALCALTQPIASIAKDESLNGVFNGIAARMQADEHMTNFEKIGELLGAVPVLLDTHYADTIRIIAIMTGRTDAEVEKLNGYEMISEFRASIDKQFIDFFRSSAAMAQTSMGKSE